MPFSLCKKKKKADRKKTKIKKKIFLFCRRKIKKKIFDENIVHRFKKKRKKQANMLLA